MALYILALVGIIASLRVGAIVPFLGASLVVGIAQGAASTGGIRALLINAKTDQRAGLLATIYLISYCAAAFPGIIAARLTRTLDLSQIALGYALLGGTAAIIAIIAARNSNTGTRA